MGRPFNTTTPLGQRLLEMNMSASELAASSGVYVRTISNYLAGTPIHERHLMSIADALECEPDEL